MPQLYQKDGTNPLHPWTTNAEAVAPSDFTLNLDHASLSRKGRLRAQVDKRLSCSLLDLWVSGFVPVTLRPWFLNTPMLPTFVFVYCLLSGFILSGRIYSTLSTSFGIKGSPSDSSLLSQLPLDHLLSKVSSLHLQPLMLNPNVLSTPLASLTFAACLWTSETEIEQLETWAAEWRGPMSVLVTTSATPSSVRYEELTVKLATLQRKHPPLKQHLFVHLLHVDPADENHPNAFLNLARLLAPTPRVVLFPGNLSTVPPKTLYRTLLHQQPSSSSAMASQGHVRKRRPAVLTSRERTSFPFAPLAPLVLARDDSTWCTERFFAQMPRVSDWEECLWQVWLGHFGDLEVRQTPGIPSDAPDVVENAAIAQLHRRLVSKFRSETCGLAVRRFAALRDPNSSTDTKKARWLKRVCRGWSSR